MNTVLAVVVGDLDPGVQPGGAMDPGGCERSCGLLRDGRFGGFSRRRQGGARGSRCRIWRFATNRRRPEQWQQPAQMLCRSHRFRVPVALSHRRPWVLGRRSRRCGASVPAVVDGSGWTVGVSGAADAAAGAAGSGRVGAGAVPSGAVATGAAGGGVTRHRHRRRAAVSGAVAGGFVAEAWRHEVGFRRTTVGRARQRLRP